MKKQTKTIIIAVVVLAILAGAFTAVWLLTRPDPQEGEKALHVEIIADGRAVKTLDFRTDALWLRGALEEQVTLEGDESAFGLMIKSVDGIAADESKEEWWCITKDGETLYTGADSTPVEDGDRFELTLTAGW